MPHAPVLQRASSKACNNSSRQSSSKPAPPIHHGGHQSALSLSTQRRQPGSVCVQWRCWPDAMDVQCSQYKTTCKEAAACQETETTKYAMGHRLGLGSLRDREWWRIKEFGNSNPDGSCWWYAHLQSWQSSRLWAAFSSKCGLGDQDFLDGVFPEIRRRTDQHVRNVHFRVPAVIAALGKLVPSKATGPDGIPARVLKQCSNDLALPLSTLFTLSFKTLRYIPSCLEDCHGSPHS